MSIYICKGDTPEDLEKAERFKKIFLRIAFERNVFVAPRNLHMNYDYHFYFGPTGYSVSNTDVVANIKRWGGNFYAIYQAAVDEIIGRTDRYEGMVTTTTIMNF